MRGAVLVALVISQILRLAVQGWGGPPRRGGIVGGWGAFVWFVLIPVALMLVPFVLAGQVYLLAPMAAIVVLAFPWPIARLVLVPLGQPRLAYWLAYTSDYTFRIDREGGAALAAAWAIGRARRLDEEDLAWIADRLGRPGAALRGAGIVASGLLLAARGDLEGARASMASVRALDPEACPPEALRRANAWLMADAAARGAWAETVDLPHTLAQTGRDGWLLAGVARALLLEAYAPRRKGLWLRWILAPHRRATLPIVRRALAALDGAFLAPDDAPAPPPPAPAGDDAWSAALALHAAVLARPSDAIRAEDLAAASAAWDAVLDDRATERSLLDRAAALGASGAGPALERLRAAVLDDLAAAAIAAKVPLRALDGKGALAERIRLRLRDQMLTEVEALSDALRRRIDDRRELPPADEWREWIGLCLAYERGVARAGDDFRRLAFAKVQEDACSLACWLFNDRGQRPLGNAIFRFLLREAEALDDPRAIALHTKNVACGV